MVGRRQEVMRLDMAFNRFVAAAAGVSDGRQQ
jgi:hypothetical protein